MVFACLLLAMLPTESIARQHDGITPEAAGQIAELFPETTGTFSLREKVSARLGNLELKVVNFEVMREGKKIGEVTRVVSLLQEGLAANLDLLVRYDDRGAIQGIVPLKPWNEGVDNQGIARLLWSLKGHDLRTNNAALVNLITGLSAGTALTDGLAPPPPQGGYPLSVQQLLLEPGAQLPGLKVKDLAGKSFDASSYKQSKLLISFLSPDNSRSGEMALAVEKAAAQALRDKKVAVIHIVTAPAGTAADYVQTLGLKGIVAADPASLLARMFQVPYSPYLFMFDKGVLIAPLTWEGEQKLQHALRQFLNGDVSTAKGAAK
jgi:hypothetical protein